MVEDGSNVHGGWIRSVHEPTSMRYHPRRRRNSGTRSGSTQCILWSSPGTRFRRPVAIHNRRRISWQSHRIHPLDTGCARSKADRGSVLPIYWRDQKRKECQGMLLIFFRYSLFVVRCLLFVCVAGGFVVDG